MMKMMRMIMVMTVAVAEAFPAVLAPSSYR
jgi:hypothetical protein